MIQETFPMTVGGEEVLNERELLAGVENGLMMDSADSVRYIILHCSATRCNCDYTVEQLLRDHRARGFRTIGYHFYVRRDGTVSPAGCSKWGLIAVPSIGVPSAYATKAGWTRKDILPTRSPGSSSNNWNNCCPGC